MDMLSAVKQTRAARGLSMSPKAQGFTLLELMVVVSMVSILIAIAVPAFTSTIERSRQSTAVSDIARAIDIARNEAVSRVTTVELCASSDGNTCSGSAAWESGFLVRSVSASEVFQVWEEIPGGITVKAVNFADDAKVRFSPEGLVDAAGTFVICGNAGASGASAVVLNISGLGRLAVDDDDSGNIIDDNLGRDVTCG